MIDIKDFPRLSTVIGFFEEISKIPRGSANTEKIAEYLVRFAEERDLEYVRDGADNVIIKKPATKGREASPAVIIQGHTDMVCEKRSDYDLDMAAEGLRLYRDGDFLRADGTTLGGDDGVAVAYALALLDATDISHPQLECVFTSNEEIGLLGATALDGKNLLGRLMINIDGDEEGVFTVGCAGGVRADIALPIEYEAPDGKFYSLKISGLMGGHSGIEIDKGRLNAIKILAECLDDMGEIRLADFSGGNADNAIPRMAQAVFCTKRDEILLLSIAERLCDTYRVVEDGVKIELEEAAPRSPVLDLNSTNKLLSLTVGEPTGVIAMSGDVDGLVETSLNMGIARLGEEFYELSFSVRSSIEESKYAVLCELDRIAWAHRASITTRGDYPGWSYRSDSHLREVMQDVYEKMFGEVANITMIHAGLECGIFAGKLEGLDCVSIGPTNLDIHTPDERLSLSSTARTWDFLIEVLKQI